MFAEPEEPDRWARRGPGSCHDDHYEPPDAVDRVLEVATMVSVFAAEQLARVADLRDEAVHAARLRGRVNAEIIDRSVRLELASALRITEYAAGEMLALAERLVHRYPSVLDSLHRADITQRHAEILVAAVDSIEPEHRGDVLVRGLDLARSLPVGAFRRELAKLVDTVREVTLAERHALALRARRVTVEQDGDAMAWTHWYGPAVEARAAFERATAIAKALASREGETRTLDQLRSDAVADLLIEGAAESHPQAARSIRASVVVTVPALALLSGSTSAVESDCDPATVEGVGPIPLDRARELCGGSTEWMRVLTHPETGMVLSVGRTRYRPPPELAKLVKWRAERCMAPGCGVPAARCQIDHTLAWEHGGSTSLANHAPLCQGHHTVKHHGDWVVRQVGGGGALEWISPAGRRYVVEPERRIPVFLATDESPAPF